jgi:hypothetical protein
MAQTRFQSRWKEFCPYTSADMPCVPAVYVLYDRNEPSRVYYVGSTVNLRQRIVSHWTNNCGMGYYFNHETILLDGKYSESRKAGDWLMREYRLIRRLQPEANAKHGPRRHLLG